MFPKYLDRITATQRLREQGVVIGDNRLADLAHEKRGPKFVVINGRALYTFEWLLAWIEAEAARPTSRRRRKHVALEERAEAP